MKKYILYTFLLGILLAACNPNKDIYDMIEDNEKPYYEEFDLEFTEADYTLISKFILKYAQTEEDSMIANDLDIYKSFSRFRSAADIIPAYLEDTYIALDSASKLNIKYKYSVNEYDSIFVKTFANSDYFDFFGTADTCFSSTVKPSDYIFTVDTSSNYVYYITCRYGNTYATSEDTSIAYTYIDGSWEIPDNFYILTEDDYEIMGRPGVYHYFSETDRPEVYLPTFFKNNYPFNQSLNKVVVFYKYDTGDTEIMMDAYKFDGTVWTNTIDKISPFIHNGTEWLFDPTIRYEMTLSEDFQIIVDYVTNNPDIPNDIDPEIPNDGYLDDYYPETTEYYYGANSYYRNFYLKLYKRRLYDPLGLLEGLTDEEALENMFERINVAIGIFLDAKFPNAEPIQNGVEVYYAITYETYEENSVRNHFTVTYKCVGIGEFEYISGPELVE